MEYYQNEKRAYSVFEEKLESEEGIQYKAYGIRVRGYEGKDIVISDVTDDREALESLVRLCNDGDLDIIHIYDVVEDFLAV